MNRTALTIAAAVSLSLCAGTLTAGEQDKKKVVEGDVSPGVTTQGVHRGEGMEQVQNWDAEMVMEEYDLNDDGELDEGELGVFGAAAAGTPHGVRAGEDRGEELMNSLDQDGDGVVGRDELQQSDMLGDKKKQHQGGSRESGSMQ